METILWVLGTIIAGYLTIGLIAAIIILKKDILEGSFADIGMMICWWPIIFPTYLFG